MAKNVKKFDPIPRVHAIESTKFQLTAPKLDGGDFPPKLSWKMWGGNPRLEFRAGFKYGNGGEGTYFLAKMDVPVATSLLNLVKMYADDDSNETIEQIALTCGTEKEGGKPWEIEHNTRIYVGKDSKGVYINVQTKTSTYNVKFHITPSIYHKFIDANNNPISSTRLAKIYAKQYAQDLIDLMILHSHESSYRGAVGETTVYHKKDGDNDGDDNGNRSNNNNSNSGSSSNANWETDNNQWV